MIDWDEFVTKSRSTNKALVSIGGVIHDVSDFITEHPGGKAFISSAIAEDATAMFKGGSISTPMPPILWYQRCTLESSAVDVKWSSGSASHLRVNDPWAVTRSSRRLIILETPGEKRRDQSKSTVVHNYG